MRMISRNGLIFRIEDSGEATLTECGESAPVLELPAEIEGHLLTDIEPDAFDHCGPVEAFAVQAGSTSLRVRDGVLFDRTGVRLIRYPSGRTDREYMPPSGTGIIGCAWGFRGKAHLTEHGAPVILDTPSMLPDAVE